MASAAPCPVPVEAPPCPVCGGSTHRTVLRDVRDVVWGKAGTFALQRCEHCGLVATRPRPMAGESLSYFYQDTYSGRGEEQMRRFQTADPVGRLIAWYRFAVLGRTRRITAADHLLDVGCSYGGFLRFARQRSGCRVSGIDLDEGTVAGAVDAEITDYRVGSIEQGGYAPRSFSIVTFLESLEHHPNPVAALRTTYELLEPGGVCMVEVPNYGGLWRRVFRTAWLPLLVPQHLYHFTPQTLRKALLAAGFDRIEHQQTMFYPLEGIASLGIWLGRLLRLPRPGTPPSKWWHGPVGGLLGILLCVLYPIVEIPSQALLRWVGLAGHQVAIARKAQPLRAAPRVGGNGASSREALSTD